MSKFIHINVWFQALFSSINNWKTEEEHDRHTRIQKAVIKFLVVPFTQRSTPLTIRLMGTHCGATCPKRIVII